MSGGGHGRRRKGHEEEHENHERWLVSYADFITLLFAFFVVMYSVSKVDNKKLSQAAESIKWAMHYGGSGGVTQMPLFEGAPTSGGGKIIEGNGAGSGRQMESLKRRLEARVQGSLAGGHVGLKAVTITVEGGRLTLRLAAAEFFDEGRAALRPQILPLLDAIAEEIAPLERPLRVEGHTDDRPVVGTRYGDNWDLSAARAATVVSYLERAHHVRPELLSATGLAATRPVAPGDDAESRELNRRVEIAIELERRAAPRSQVQHPDAPTMGPAPAGHAPAAPEPPPGSGEARGP